MGTKHNVKYVVTLTGEERKELLDLVQKGKSAAATIKHASILLASDENGENLPASAVAMRTRPWPCTANASVTSACMRMPFTMACRNCWNR